MKNEFAIVLSAAVMLISVWLPGQQSEAQQYRQRQQTRPPGNYYLPKATFPSYAGGGSSLSPSSNYGAGMSNQLPVVSGLHLQEGEDRRPGTGAEVYNPGEPSLNMALVRWDKKRFPLKVWISEGKKLPEVPWEVITQDRVPRVSEMLKNPQSLEALPTAPGWKPEMNDTAANGFEEWRQDKTPPVPFGFVPDPTDADILVFFTDRFAGSDGPGGTSVHGQTYGQLFTTEQYHQKLQMRQPKVPVIIELRVNEELEKFQADAAHEFGHALGIKAHSPFRQDLMYVNRMVETPSPADLATLRALYTQTPKYWYY